MSQQEEYARLKLLRVSRDKEYQEFAAGGIITILQRLIGFLTDLPSDGISLYVGGDESYTDGKSITLGLPDMFFALSYGVLDWANILKALEAHEVQHINSSSFEELKKIQDDFAAYMVPRGLPQKTAMDVAKTMLNILEDGRIENIIVHKMPGYRVPLLMLNSAIRASAAVEKAADTPGQEYADFHNEILSYTKTGRHLPNAAVYKDSRLEKEFRAIQGYIDAAVVAVSAKDCAGLCRKLLWQASDYLLELLKNKEAQEQASEMTPDDEFTSNNEHEFNPGPSSGSSGKGSSPEKGDSGKGDNSDSSGSPDDGDGDEEGGGGGSSSDGDGTNPGKDGKGSKPSKDGPADGKDSNDSKSGGKKGGNGNQLPERLLMDRSEDWTDDFSETGSEGYLPMTVSPEELAQIRKGVSDEIQVNKEALKPSASQRPMKDIEEFYAGESQRLFVESFPCVPTSPLPPEILTPARRLEKEIRKILQQKHSERRGTRTGVLDTRCLYKSRLRDPHIFYKKGKPIKADMAVYFLMDNSGSMNGCGAVVNGGRLACSKSTLSRIAASIIEYALRDLARVKISLFDVSLGKIRHATLKQFDEKTNGTRVYNSINHVGIGCGNKDGYSIRVATKELAARRESMKVLLILSDGLPSDYNGGEKAGLIDVKNAVKEARQKGIRVIPIMFGDARFRAQSAEDFAFMYDSFISCNPVDVCDEFYKLFASLVKKS